MGVDNLTDEAAERAVVGSVLIDAVFALPICKGLRLSPDSFTNGLCRRMFEAAVSLFEDSKPVDTVSVNSWLKDRSMGVNPTEYSVITDATPTVAHVEHYARIVRGKMILRKIYGLCSEIHSEIGEVSDAEEYLAQVPRRFMESVDDMLNQRTNRDVIKQIIQDFRDIDAGKKKIGLPLPWTESNGTPGRLWRMLGGLQPGLIVVGGRPSEGKTTLETNLSEHVASMGYGVARVTMDMTHEKLLARALSRKSEVSLPMLMGGYAKAARLDKVADVGEVIADWPMWINEGDNEIGAILTWARAMKYRHNIGMLTLDYCQQIEDANCGNNTNDHQVITKVSRKLKRVANELKIPVLLISQLNRAGEQAQRPPRLSDLRGSGSLEQDASVAMLVYREQRIPKEFEKQNNGKRPIWIEIAKQQNGETGAVEFWLHQNYFRLEEAPLGSFERHIQGADEQDDRFGG